jgi:hypothetical protein
MSCWADDASDDNFHGNFLMKFGWEILFVLGRKEGPKETSVVHH